MGEYIMRKVDPSSFQGLPLGFVDCHREANAYWKSIKWELTIF